MVMAVVSTFALVLAFGPQLQVNLQAAVDTPAADVALDEDVRDAAVPPASEQAPATDQSIEAVEETIITPDEIATAETSETALLEAAVPEQPTAEPETTVAQNGDVPESEWAAILSDASAALAAAKTARGNFIQTNADGSIVTGTFALNRPGRMRFEYDDPTPILIVSDGTTVAMEDRELDTVDRFPIGSTPLGIILSTQLNVEDDVEVLGIVQNDERVGIRVSDASGELEGMMTMVFDKTNYALMGWLAVDANLQTTVVDLTDIETNVSIDPRLFRLNEDDDEEDDR